MKAIILAAGMGTRLAPITDNRPKHILEIAGKSIIQRIIDKLLISNQVDEIIIVTHHYETQIIEHLQSIYSNSIFNKLKFIHQNEPNGTGGAVKAVNNEIQLDGSFLVIYGDLILNNGIELILDSYEKDPNLGAVLAFPVENPENYGCLIIEDNQVLGINEKDASSPPGSLINAGVYLFPKNVVHQLEELKLSNRNEFELTDLIAIGKEYGVQYIPCLLSEGWFDIGKPWELLNANEFLIEKESINFEMKGVIENNVTIKGKVHLEEGAKLLSGTYIEGDVYISSGAIIGPNCYIRGKSYLGKNVRIGNACEVKNSIIYEGTHAAHLSYIGDSVLGRNCNLGAGTITANLRHDGANIKFNVKDERVMTNRRKLGVIMGDSAKTGIGVNLLPGIKISSGFQINAGDLVDRDR